MLYGMTEPEEDPAKEFLAEAVPQPEPWPEPRQADRTVPEVYVVQPKHSRLADGLKGAAALAAGLYVYDALTDDSGSDQGDS
ncbi:hypothetical protein EV192_11391 [Actinocrispum wychmicini]|uniref:Uncharacterized protein n=2 Tax=Actinocrispum wychmicini TaxID=1213861 RepID=A0A4R2IY36_9PSEU|nr:hypothetical protein EV192_11391 [Actinocrispum wychmicini]